MIEGKLLDEVHDLLVAEPRLIELGGVERAVIVGDTHGDFDATRRVMERYLTGGTAVVFLGDYVDRGPQSRENLEYLLRLKLDHPERIYLAQGNHEGWQAFPFAPADFWEGLDAGTRDRCAEALAELPWAISLPNGVLALHGALPALEELDEINEVVFGDERWRQIAWGDWQDAPGEFLGDLGGRPQLGRDHFERQMDAFGMTVLVRSHQPNAPQYLFDDRCLTVFTSHAYGPRERTVAVVALEEEVETARDLSLESV